MSISSSLGVENKKVYFHETLTVMTQFDFQAECYIQLESVWKKVVGTTDLRVHMQVESVQKISRLASTYKLSYLLLVFNMFFSYCRAQRKVKISCSILVDKIIFTSTSLYTFSEQTLPIHTKSLICSTNNSVFLNHQKSAFGKKKFKPDHATVQVFQCA